MTKKVSDASVHKKEKEQERLLTTFDVLLARQFTSFDGWWNNAVTDEQCKMIKVVAAKLPAINNTCC
ncbi:MAG: hypothetical protein ACFFD4_05960 [Candidatus Odinarchaeota archaeon]